MSAGLRFINVRLPHREDLCLYELKAEVGKWVSIRLQDRFLDARESGASV